MAADLDTAWAIACKISSRGNSDDNRAAFLGALIARHCPEFSPGNITHIVNAFQILAVSIKRFAEMDCNQGLTDRQQATMDAKKAAFHALAASCGFAAATGGDPRGPCASLLDPANPDAGDGWGGGWTVYR